MLLRVRDGGTVVFTATLAAVAATAAAVIVYSYVRPVRRLAARRKDGHKAEVVIFSDWSVHVGGGGGGGGATLKTKARPPPRLPPRGSIAAPRNGQVYMYTDAKLVVVTGDVEKYVTLLVLDLNSMRDESVMPMWRVAAVSGDPPKSSAFLTTCMMMQSSSEDILVAWRDTRVSSMETPKDTLASSHIRLSMVTKSVEESAMRWQKVHIRGLDVPRCDANHIGHKGAVTMCAIEDMRRVAVLVMDWTGNRIDGVWVLNANDVFATSQRSLVGREGIVMSASRVIFAETPRSSLGAIPALVMSGPSGVGKGSLLDRLTREHGDDVGFSVSHTSRAPRPGEVDGEHYHFRTKEVILSGVERGDFIEHAHVHGNVYGTSKAAVMEVIKQGKVCLLDIDVQGAAAVQASDVPSVRVFILPPSMKELERRLRSRGTESEASIAKRLHNAKEEVRVALKGGRGGGGGSSNNDEDEEEEAFHVLLVNDDLDETYQQLRSLVVRSKPAHSCATNGHNTNAITDEPKRQSQPWLMDAVSSISVEKGQLRVTAAMTPASIWVPKKRTFTLRLEGGSSPGYTMGSWEAFMLP